VHAVPPQPADHITTLHVTHYKLPASLSPSLSLCLPLKFVLSFSLALPPIVSSIDVTRGGQTSVNVFYTGCTHNQREREREREREISRDDGRLLSVVTLGEAASWGCRIRVSENAAGKLVATANFRRVAGSLSSPSRQGQAGRGRRSGRK